jgi:ATP-dependent DNA helicase PIF1
MRLSGTDLNPEAQQELATFSKWILDVGEGKIEATARDGETEPTWIKIPHELLLMPTDNKLSSLIDVVYPNLSSEYLNIPYLRQRAILTTTNETADYINSYIVSIIPGQKKQYLSCDRISKTPDTHESYEMLYPLNF